MQCGTKLLSYIGACAFVVTLAGCGTTPETRSDTTQQMRTAQATLDDFRNDPDMRWFREHLKDAKAVIISPRVTRAGFVFGGSGGEALVLARNDTGRWVGPAFYNMGAGSVGLQVGVTSRMGVSARLSTWSATLPYSQRPRPLRPWVDITIRSASRRLASFAMMSPISSKNCVLK